MESKTTNAVSTRSWLEEWKSQAGLSEQWMADFIERIQQSSYGDGYIDGNASGYAEGAGVP